MPKIIVREYDNTTAGESEYSNFTIVIPGYVAKETEFAAVADDNGIYECSTKKDFIANIGKYDYATGYGAESPKLTIDDEKINLAQIETYYNHIYTGTENTTGKIGYLKDDKYIYTLATEVNAEWGTDTYYTRSGEEGSYVYTVVDKEAVPHPTYTDTYYTRSGEGTEESPYVYTEVSKETFKTANKFTVIEKDNEGKDATAGIENLHPGNRMAFELVKLGYTILYKKLVPGKESELEYTEDATTGEINPYWSCLKDKSNYDFRYICTGGYNKKPIDSSVTTTYDVASICKAYHGVSDVAEYRNNLDQLDAESQTGRGDCIALMDVVEDDTWKTYTQENIIKEIRNQICENFGFLAETGVGKFSSIFAPRINYSIESDAAFGDDTTNTYIDLTFPGSFHYLACAAKAFQNYAEWYAVAGYVRGICDYKINGTTLKLGELAVNALEPRTIKKFKFESTEKEFKYAVNVITNIRGNIYTWGNRTAHILDNDGLIASHFLNIRQLCCTLKKQIYISCKALTFSPNSDLLWIDFCNAIRPTLEKMKADQGIEDYKFVKVKSTKKALMTAKIKIVPIEAVEDFDISVYLEDSISGTTVGVEEE